MALELVFHQPQIRVIPATTPAGPVKVLHIRDPQSGIAVSLTFGEHDQAEFTRMWHGGVHVAEELPEQLRSSG